ncbi:hypothetical protein MMC11_000734 [Xylographa trunciseda]|nr:hypothetical protein [Xylographa trunciseda]
MDKLHRPLAGSDAVSVGRFSTSPASKKLIGRAFYESLGSPKMILAPMVDQSEFVGDSLAWRALTRSFMNPEASRDLLAYTPMLHARLFTETIKYRDHHFQPTRTGLASMPQVDADTTHTDSFLDGHPAFDRPLAVQFCANEPEELLEAAKYVQPYCDVVDLNLGCPQGIARRGNYGAFLQEDWDRIYRLINILHMKLDIPVSAKIRILETKERTLDYAKMVVSAGASILTVHGRQRDQKGHKTGLADWSVLRYLRENLPPDTVIFANGNILRHEDIARCLEMTGADGVMSAEGNLYDPTIFGKPPQIGSEGREYWRGRDGRGGYRMDAVFRRYMDIIYRYVLETPPPSRKPLFLPSDPPPIEDPASRSPTDNTEQPPAKRQRRDNKPERTTSPNLISMQAHLFHLLRSLVSQHTEIRDALARCRAGDIPAFENVLALVEKVTREGLIDYESHPEKYDEAPEEASNVAAKGFEAEPTDYESSVATVKACKRPWWVCQPYVRPLPKEALEKGSLTLSKKDKKKMEDEAATLARTADEARNVSRREDLDAKDGLERSEIAQQAMVCG